MVGKFSLQKHKILQLFSLERTKGSCPSGEGQIRLAGFQSCVVNLRAVYCPGLSTPQFSCLSNGGDNNELFVVRISWCNGDLVVATIK